MKTTVYEDRLAQARKDKKGDDKKGKKSKKNFFPVYNIAYSCNLLVMHPELNCLGRGM